MPYIPAKDRKVLDPLIDAVATEAANKITTNNKLVDVYVDVFLQVSTMLFFLSDKDKPRDILNDLNEKDLVQLGLKELDDTPENRLASAIWGMGEKYDYEGAFLGELNYAFTMFIQKVPQVKVEKGEWKEELRYWIYARTDEALRIASNITLELGFGIGGVIGDVLAEYKYQVNAAYEVEQILKSGHCYFGPYYKRPVEVVDANGAHVGYMDVMLKRSEETLHKDLLDGQVVLEVKKKL